MGGYLRSFIPSFSMFVAAISNLLCDKRFQGKKTCKAKVPWAKLQSEAMAKLIELLIDPAILALPDWNKPFELHTDASEIGAGAVLTQFRGNVEKSSSRMLVIAGQFRMK